MNTIIQYLQIASAVYVLAIAAVYVAVVTSYTITGRESKASIKGYPAVVALLACVVCAASTLVLLPS